MRVGLREGQTLDPDRPRWDGSAARPISWVCWYPTAGGGGVETESFAGPPATPWFRIGPVVPEAPLADDRDRYPLVLLSHGTGGDTRGLGWLAHGLAGRGFIVIGANHHGNTAGEPYLAEGFLCWWERARDLSVLLDHAASIPGFGERIDFGHIHAAGFSLGGYTVAALLGAITDLSLFQRWAAGRSLGSGPREFPNLSDEVPVLMERSAPFRESVARQSDSYRDDRIRSALICAPAPPVRAFTEPSLATIRRPVRIIVGDDDSEAPASGGAIWLHERLSSSRLKILTPDVGHFVFLPVATEDGRRQAANLCVDLPGVDRQAIHAQTLVIAADLFETT